MASIKGFIYKNTKAIDKTAGFVARSVLSGKEKSWIDLRIETLEKLAKPPKVKGKRRIPKPKIESNFLVCPQCGLSIEKNLLELHLGQAHKIRYKRRRKR